MGKTDSVDKKKGAEISGSERGLELIEPVVPSVQPVPAEPKIPFQEFSMTTGLDKVLLAGFAAHERLQKGVSHRTQAEWLVAYQAFACLPA